MNRLYFGDNLKWLHDRREFPDASVDLVYLDPPFNSNADYNVLTVASGLLAVTVTFRTSLLSAVGGTIRSPRLLIVAWVALVLTVATGLLTHFGHVQAQTQAIRAMLAGHIGAGQPNLFFRLCWWFMAISFVVALGTFVLFAALNTPH